MFSVRIYTYDRSSSTPSSATRRVICFFLRVLSQLFSLCMPVLNTHKCLNVFFLSLLLLIQSWSNLKRQFYFVSVEFVWRVLQQSARQNVCLAGESGWLLIWFDSYYIFTLTRRQEAKWGLLVRWGKELPDNTRDTWVLLPISLWAFWRWIPVGGWSESSVRENSALSASFQWCGSQS